MINTLLIKKNFEDTCNILRNKIDILSDIGSCFVFFKTLYGTNGIIHDFFDLIKVAQSYGYEYVNTIVYPTAIKNHSMGNNNVQYIVWLCKNSSLMHFNKDAIREKHIWKDVEWGHRSKNYNPIGKDPGNVWIPTEDDGKAHITHHILLSENEVIKKLLTMTECGDNYVQYFDVEQDECPYNTTNVDIIEDTCNCPLVSGKVVFHTSEKMDLVKDSSVQAIVTSPPYWNLKDYFKQGQIGQESYEKYLERMLIVWQECYDKLRPDGSLWINVNIRRVSGKAILIPHDIIQLCKKIGFYYKEIFVWHKSSGIPTSRQNIVDRHEYILVFTKQGHCKFYPAKQALFNDYKNNAINGGTLWNINRKAGSVGKKYIHPAIYPNELVRRVVMLATQCGDMVLDPFLGSGTTMIVALQERRKFIGYEYNEQFASLIKYRCDREVPFSYIDYVFK